MVLRTRFFIPAVAFLAAISLLWAPTAHSQWSVVKYFGVEVRSVYFLDQQGAAATGFAGLANSTIWRTTDNGKTWSQLFTPNTASPMQVTDFAFSNTTTGWCSVRSQDDSTGEIWKTTNGGLTWILVYSGGAFVSIAYSPASGILVAPCWSYGTDLSVQSSDAGVTWTTFAPAWHNGATFSGANGVIGNYSTPASLYSTDGGATWNDATGLPEEAWAPHGIPGYTMFVAAAEKTHQFFLSTDGGASWANPYTFTVHPTGCIMGTTAKMLFVQTEFEGLYFSSDTGKSWTTVCGPNNGPDTRFYSIGKEVFAGDYSGNMWYTPDGTIIGNQVLGLDRTSLNFFGLRCTTYDSILHFYYGAGCNTATLTKAQILTGSPEFSLGSLSLPQSFSGVDSLKVLYAPSSALHDFGTLMLEFDIGSLVVDTIVHLYGTGQSVSVFSHVDSLAMSNPYACMTGDTSIVLHNVSCDTLTLFRATIGNQPMFQLLPLKLPLKIPPHDSTIITISTSSGQDGLFLTFLKITTLNSGGGLLTDSIPITLNVLQGAEALFSPINISEPYACSGIDTVFTISVTPCDSLTLLSATLSDSSIFHLGVLTLPMSIKASGAVTLPIQIAPGSKGIHTTILHLHYQSGQAIVDSSITLTTQVLYDLPLHIDLSSNTFDLGNAGVPCETTSRWITFHNGLCRDLTIKRISWVNVNNQFSFDPKSLPDTLAHDTGVDSILVHFSPTSAITESNQLRVTLDLDGRELDTLLTISGTGIQAYHDTLLTPALQYDSVAQCLSSEREGEIVNLSCDSVIATSATFVGSLGYSVIGPAFPAALSHGDTLHVRFLLQPTQTGSASDIAVITLHDLRNDSDYTDTIVLTGYVLAGRHVLSLSSIAFSMPSIAPCSVLDSSLLITNRGCDDVVITDTSLAGYDGLEFLPPLILPDTIAPDSTAHIPFRILPNRDSLESTLLSLQGQNIDITINFSYAALPGSPALTLSVPDSVFVSRPCVPVSKTFWITNTGCESDTLNTLALSGLPGASQFTLQNPPTLPAILTIGDTLHFTIQFDPNGNGDGLATLDVNSKGANFTRSVELAGRTTGTVPTARIALQASDGSLQCSGMANQLASVVAKLLDDIGDSTALSTVAITLRANWNLLTPWNFSPSAGWSVLDTSTLSDGDFQIRIHHDVPGAITAGTALVNCSFFITVSDSTGCDIGMSNVRFNDSSANYEGCVLSSVAMPDPVHFTEGDTCGAPELRGLMEGRLALRIISVIPNPATITDGSAQMNVTFDLARATDVRIMVRDVIGRECFHIVQPFTSGLHTQNLQVPGAAEGIYFIQMEAEGQVAEAKVVVQNPAANLTK